MSDRDPIDVLSTVDRPEAPDARFRSDLLDRLLGDVVAEAESSPPPSDVLELSSVEDIQAKPRRWRRPVLAAAAAAAAVAAIVAFLAGGDDEGLVEFIDAPTPTVVAQPTPAPTAVESTPTPRPTEEPLPTPVVLPALPFQARPPQPELTLELAQALLAELGPEGLVLGSVDEEDQVELITFDPNRPDRFLLADLNSLLASVPRLASVDDRQISVAEFDEGARATGGQFTRDGYVVRGGSSFDTSLYILDPDTEAIVADIDSGLLGSLYDVQGSSTLTMSANQVGCPFTSINVNTSSERHLVDERDNAFARVAIIEPGIGMAFPYGPDKDDCSPTEAERTRAWSMVDGAPVDHPLADLAIARAAVSGDGTRAVWLTPEGGVTVVSLPSLEVIAELGAVEALHTFVPLALNENGTIAAASGDDGVLRVWHVATATLLLERTSEPITVTDRLRAGSMLAYDASRAALRQGPEDDDPAAWEIITLDANDWIERACEAGFVLSDADRAASAIDSAVTCVG